METLLAAEATTTAGNHNPVRCPNGPTSDDLTNLSWVAGTPVPMNTSVSPPDTWFAKKANISSSGLQITHTENTVSSTKTIAVKKKLFKTPLPTYKIILKDQKDQSDQSISSNSSTADKDDCSVIFANVMSEQPSDYDLNGRLDFDFLLDKVIPVEDNEDDDLCDPRGEEGSGTLGEGMREKVKSMNKPNCSYTCLIGMALKASSGCLPVNAIYQYIEKEFPYFLTAPDGWKNSVRHNLSLNPIFCKVNPDGWFGKKGHLWEVSPNKQHLVDKEIQRYLHCTGKTLNKFSVPMKACYSRSKPSSRKQLEHSSPARSPVLCSRCTKIVSPTPHDSSTSSDDSSKQNAADKEVKKYCIDMKEEVKSGRIQVKPKVRATASALDINESPLKYAGIRAPPNDPKMIAKDLFGLPSTPEHMFSPMNYPGPFIPIYPQPAHFGVPIEGFNQTPPPCSPSPSTTASTPSPLNNPMAAYAMPLPFMMWGHYAQFCNNMLSRETSTSKESFNGVPQMIPVAATSVKVPSCSDPCTEALNSGVQRTPQKKRAQNQAKTRNSPDVACLNSPLKRMKVEEGGFLVGSVPDENVSSYFADVSSNEIFSDSDQATDDEIQGTPLPLTSLSLQTNQHRKESGESSPLSNLSPQARNNLDQIAGDSDLNALLTNGFKSIITKAAKTTNVVNEHTQSKVVSNGYSAEEVECVSSMDFHDIDSMVSSSQKDTYYLPRLDSLLHIGDDTIMSIKTAMNLDVHASITAEEKCNKEKQEENHLKHNVTVM